MVHQGLVGRHPIDAPEAVEPPFSHHLAWVGLLAQPSVSRSSTSRRMIVLDGPRSGISRQKSFSLN